jgi:hypothetical protein
MKTSQRLSLQYCKLIDTQFNESYKSGAQQNIAKVPLAAKMAEI